MARSLHVASSFQDIPLNIPLNALQTITPDIPILNWVHANINTIGDLYHLSSLLPFQHLKNDLSHLTQGLFKDFSSTSTLSRVTWKRYLFFWHLLKFYYTDQPHQKGISYTYKLLTDPAPDTKTSAMLHWENLLNCNYTPQQWQSAHQRPLKVSRCITHWKTLQKILNNWYCPGDFSKRHA